MKSCRSFYLIFFALLVVSLAPGTAKAQTESFFCDGAIAFNALFTPNGESVLIEFQGQVKVILKQAVSGSGTRYTGGGYELHGKDGAWTLTRPGSTTVNCAQASKPKTVETTPPAASPPSVTPSATTPPVSTTTNTPAPPKTLPGQAGVHIKFPHPAYSFGGKVRSRPSMESRRLAGLDEGEEITLLKNTGVRMGEHDWFKIKFRGRTGFQWGGIMCTDDIKAVGILSICPQFEAAKPKQTTRETCKRGQYWSRSRKKCRWYADKKKKVRRCPRGTVWTEEGNFCQDEKAAFCGPGYHWNKRQKRCQQNH